MGKKYLAILLSLFVILAIFAACEKTYKYGIIITDNNGKTRVLATDKNGKTMTDEAGNIILLETEKGGKPVTDKNGNQATQKVSPPAYYELGDTVHGAKFTVNVLSGWEQDKRVSHIRLTHKATGSQLNLMDKTGQTYDNAIISAEKMLDSWYANDKGAVYKVSTEKMFGVTAQKYYYDSKKIKAEMVNYIFEKNGTVFIFQTVTEDKYKGSVDFQAVLNTVKF